MKKLHRSVRIVTKSSALEHDNDLNDEHASDSESSEVDETIKALIVEAKQRSAGTCVEDTTAQAYEKTVDLIQQVLEDIPPKKKIKVQDENNDIGKRDISILVNEFCSDLATDLYIKGMNLDT